MPAGVGTTLTVSAESIEETVGTAHARSDAHTRTRARTRGFARRELAWRWSGLVHILLVLEQSESCTGRRGRGVPAGCGRGPVAGSERGLSPPRRPQAFGWT